MAVERLVQGAILTEHDQLEVVLQVPKRGLVARAHLLRGDLRHAGDDRLDALDTDLGVLAVFELRVGACLVQKVNRLVRHLAIVQVPIGELGGRIDRAGVVRDAVELGIFRQQARQDLNRFLEARLVHFDLLEAAGERSVAFHVRSVLLERRRPDAAQLAAGEGGLQKVCRIERPAARRARADDGVHLVHEQDGAGLVHKRRRGTAFTRFSKSPRKRVPATSAPMSSAKITASNSGFGTCFLTIRSARPSTMATVLPTPASPTNSGLFFLRRENTWMARRISFSRPIKVSISPAAARSFKFTAKRSSRSPSPSRSSSSPSAPGLRLERFVRRCRPW